MSIINETEGGRLGDRLSSWFYHQFGLKSFIDSCVWGYAPRLLREIDRVYCLLKGGPLYDYNKRNQSTAHVHMILSSALTQMLDRTECIMFLGTPQAIQPSDVVGDTREVTLSPWLYHELAATRWLRETAPERLQRKLHEKVAKRIDGSLQVRYQVDLSHLVPLNVNDLNTWNELCSQQEAVHSLDVLYETWT